MAGDNDEVGYRKPPKHARWKPGQSGNPSGRPKKVPTVAQDLSAELRERLTIRENGEARKIPKQRAVLKALVAKAITGDIRAINTIISCVATLTSETEAAPQPLEPVDLEIMESFLREQKEVNRRMRAQSHKAPRSGNRRRTE